MEYPELEGIPEDDQVQIAALHTHPNNPTLCHQEQDLLCANQEKTLCQPMR